jgi:hypothetical protein
LPSLGEPLSAGLAPAAALLLAGAEADPTLPSLAEPLSAGLALAAALLSAGAEAHAMPLRMVPLMHPCLCPMLPTIRP